jgi:hypothetical protein
MSWTDLTDRQRQLDRSIASCGIKLDSSSGCVNKVMKAIGANNSERDYVISRIAIRLRTQTLLTNVDEQITKAEDMLQQFEKDDKEWERKGRNLGFNFRNK